MSTTSDTWADDNISVSSHPSSTSKSEVVDDDNKTPFEYPVDDSPVDDEVTPPCPKAWIKYVEVSRQVDTGRPSHTRVVGNGPVPTLHLHDPAFEFVREYFLPHGQHPPGDYYYYDDPRSRDPKFTPSVHQAAPRTGDCSDHVLIRSPAIIAAMREVVEYYPSQNFTGDSIRVDYPYRALVHYYDDLRIKKDSHRDDDPAKMCTKLANVTEHLQLLLDFLDKEIMGTIRKEEARMSQGLQSFSHAWYAYKPGTAILETRGHGIDTMEGEHLRGFIVHSAEYVDESLTLYLWSLEAQGDHMSRQLLERRISSWDGDRRLDARFSFQTIKEDSINKWSGSIDGDNVPPAVARKIAQGHHYRQLMKQGCHYYNGKTFGLKGHKVYGLVVTDMERAPENTCELDVDHCELQFKADQTSWMCLDDLSVRLDKCDCSNCAPFYPESVSSRKVSTFEKFIGPGFWDSDLLALLLPSHIQAFVIKTKTWELLDVRGFKEASFSRSMFENSLVMRQEHKSTLQALAKGFFGRNKRGNKISTQLWAADFHPELGRGAIVHLHGQSGLGKTHTAESVAGFAKRPLMVLSPSDIGTSAAEVEKNLDMHFTRAKYWKMMVLIDEADQFVERRAASDSSYRNTLVAAFMRALDTCKCMVFLATNRVKSFDEAFISRVHLQIHFPDFTAPQRRHVWKNFEEKLVRDRGELVKLTADAKEYIDSEEAQSMKWNGREIRNAFQSAVQLAEYDDEKDDEGRILVTRAHFKAVVEMAQEFRVHLKALHQTDAEEDT